MKLRTPKNLTDGPLLEPYVLKYLFEHVEQIKETK